MKNHLTNSTAAYPGGVSPSKRLFKVSAGQYSGRIVTLIQASSSEIRLSYSDYPYISWSTPALIASDSADYPFDCYMADNADIYTVYTLGSSNDLVMRKLSFSAGDWTVDDLVTIYDGDDNYYPVIDQEPGGRLWVAWSKYSSGQYYITVKHSDTSGDSWSGGVSGPGVTLSDAASSAWVRIAMMGDYVYVVYNVGTGKLTSRRKDFLAANWESEQEILTGSGFDEHFDASVSSDGRLGIAFDNGTIQFREFNGVSWSAVQVVDSDGGEFPQVKYADNVPYLIYLKTSGTGQVNTYYSRLEGSSFTTPEILDTHQKELDRVLCYDDTAGTIEDLTDEAVSSDSADIYHSSSSALLSTAGDIVYFGLEEPFHYLKMLLSTAGSGGTVNWKYFDGLQWISFVPSGGSWHFGSLNEELLLWDDVDSIPPDWQKTIVNGHELFWVKATVLTPFTTDPVGTQISTIADIKAVVLMER
jgi:hypothetical protein